ncbi:MAG: ubiquinol-cytochrome C chaperone [Hyphomicrobiaceae bacterium]|nr:MAG: ubiquinol-cytochrome C chaperone [Hyphomicrobiaceae bacterium]
MFAWLNTRRDRNRNARKLYGSIVTQARQPAFYAAWGVPDTPQGRFEMVVLHVGLAMQRLSQAGPAGHRLAQVLTETFVTDMDDCMREMSFSDLAVPKEIKRSAAALFDRHTAYGAALASPGEGRLTAALAEQMAYLHQQGDWDAAPLAAYARCAASALAAMQDAQVLAGSMDWPDLPRT